MSELVPKPSVQLVSNVQRLICQFLGVKDRLEIDLINKGWRAANHHPGSWTHNIDCATKLEARWALKHGCLQPRHVTMRWKPRKKSSIPVPEQWLESLRSFSWNPRVTAIQKPIRVDWLGQCKQLERLHLASDAMCVWSSVLPPTLKTITGCAQLMPSQSFNAAAKWLQHVVHLEVSVQQAGPAMLSVMGASNLEHLTLYEASPSAFAVAQLVWKQHHLRVLELPAGIITTSSALDSFATLLEQNSSTLEELQLPALRNLLHHPF